MARIQFTMDESFRADMNSKTPRSKDWTYHHVLPVRYYYVAAHLMVIAWKTRGYDGTRKQSLEFAIASMCNDKQNRKKIGTLLEKVDEKDLATVRNVAKLCGSPTYGGFAGPWPGQRCDDPKDQPERLRPMSGDAAWWGGLALLREAVDCFLDKGSKGGATLDLDLDDDLYDKLVDRIRSCVTVLGDLFDEIHPFDAGDWQYCPTGSPSEGNAWLMSGEILKANAPADSSLPKLKVRDGGTFGGLLAKDPAATAVPYTTAPVFVRIQASKDKLAPKP